MKIENQKRFSHKIPRKDHVSEMKLKIGVASVCCFSTSNAELSLSSDVIRPG